MTTTLYSTQMNSPAIHYNSSFLFWLLVVSIAAVWSATLINLDYASREFPTGWQQALVQSCASHPEVCSSVQVNEEKGWFEIDRQIQVHAQIGQRVAALQLVAQALTDAQRPHTKVFVAEVEPAAHHSQKQSAVAVRNK